MPSNPHPDIRVPDRAAAPVSLGRQSSSSRLAFKRLKAGVWVFDLPADTPAVRAAQVKDLLGASF